MKPSSLNNFRPLIIPSHEDSIYEFQQKRNIENLKEGRIDKIQNLPTLGTRSRMWANKIIGDTDKMTLQRKPGGQMKIPFDPYKADNQDDRNDLGVDYQQRLFSKVVSRARHNYYDDEENNKKKLMIAGGIASAGALGLGLNNISKNLTRAGVLEDRNIKNITNNALTDISNEEESKIIKEKMEHMIQKGYDEKDMKHFLNELESKSYGITTKNELKQALQEAESNAASYHRSAHGELTPEIENAEVEGEISEATFSRLVDRVINYSAKDDIDALLERDKIVGKHVGSGFRKGAAIVGTLGAGVGALSGLALGAGSELTGWKGVGNTLTAGSEDAMVLNALSSDSAAKGALAGALIGGGLGAGTGGTLGAGFGYLKGIGRGNKFLKTLDQEKKEDKLKKEMEENLKKEIDKKSNKENFSRLVNKVIQNFSEKKKDGSNIIPNIAVGIGTGVGFLGIRTGAEHLHNKFIQNGNDPQLNKNDFKPITDESKTIVVEEYTPKENVIKENILKENVIKENNDFSGRLNTPAKVAMVGSIALSRAMNGKHNINDPEDDSSNNELEPDIESDLELEAFSNTLDNILAKNGII